MLFVPHFSSLPGTVIGLGVLYLVIGGINLVDLWAEVNGLELPEAEMFSEAYLPFIEISSGIFLCIGFFLLGMSVFLVW